MGRSRGGLITKIQALIDAGGLQVRLALTPGQTNDGKGAAMLLRDLKEGSFVFADKAYDADCTKERIGAQGVAPNVPDKIDRKHRHCFSHSLYPERNGGKRFF